MAGCYTDKNGFYPSSIESLKLELKNERIRNKMLRDDLHDNRMAVKSTNQKMQKIRNANSELIEKMAKMKRGKTNNYDEINELKATIMNYEDIIKRLNKEKRGEKDFESIIGCLKDKVFNLEQNASKDDKEKRALRKKLDSIKSLLSIKRDTFEELKELEVGLKNLLLSETVIKEEKRGNSIFQNESPSLIKQEYQADNLILPFFNYVKPMTGKSNKMYLLNNTIETCINTSDLIKKSELSSMIVQYFNQAQAAAFLYPRTALAVTSEEKKGEDIENSFQFLPEPLLDSSDSRNNSFVAQEDWPRVIQEFSMRRDVLPNILMLISREKTENGAKFVLFIVDFENTKLLRYDPLPDKTIKEEYKKVYSKIFQHIPYGNQWSTNHLLEENKGISWIYCIEFGRRLAIKVEEDGMESIANNVMKGFPGETIGFNSIDFDHM